MSCSLINKNCISCEGAKCKQCKTGFFVDATGTCTPCGDLCIECKNATKCDKCLSPV